jgi:hypothetical protein
VAVNSLPVSTSLRDEFDVAFPNRERTSDGTIGDAAHQKEVSDHNPDDTPGVRVGGSDSDHVAEVHARDVTSALNAPGWTMARVTDIIRARHKSGADARLLYIICDRRIASVTSGWDWVAYSGSDPHQVHAHFSFRYGSGNGPANPENDTRPWGIVAAVTAAREEDDMATGADVWNAEFGPANGRETAGERLANVDSKIDTVASDLEQVKADVAAILAKLK